MTRQGLAVTVFLASCVIVPAAMAQNNELTGIIGRTFISDQGVKSGALAGDTVRFGKGTTLEVNYARRVVNANLLALSLEVPFVFNPDEDYNIPPNPFAGYRTFFLTPAARLNVFPDQGVSPWVSLGGGFGYFSGSSLKNGSSTGALEIGAGLDVRLLKYLSLRGELRDFWTGVPQLDLETGKTRQHNYLVGAGVVWHF